MPSSSSLADFKVGSFRKEELEDFKSIITPYQTFLDESIISHQYFLFMFESFFIQR